MSDGYSEVNSDVIVPGKNCVIPLRSMNSGSRRPAIQPLNRIRILVRSINVARQALINRLD